MPKWALLSGGCNDSPRLEVDHILMIDRYVVGKYPELLRIRALRDNMESMNNAWNYLSSLDPGERYFAKILYNKDQTAALNRNNFSLLATAADAAAHFEIPSMQFYRGGNLSRTSGALVETVKQYLNLKMNLAYYSTVQSPYAYLSDAERQKYIQQAEAASQVGTLLSYLQFLKSQPQSRIPRFEH
jgi:hypothetical protein